MTTTIKVTCNGDYVAEVRQDDKEVIKVGPGSMVSRDFFYPHPGPSTFVISERPATAEEIEGAKPKAAPEMNPSGT